MYTNRSGTPTWTMSLAERKEFSRQPRRHRLKCGAFSKGESFFLLIAHVSPTTEAQTSATQEDNGEGIYGYPGSDKDTHLSKHSSSSNGPPASDKLPFGCGCGKCTFFSLIERGCPLPIPSASSFPYLDLSGLTHEQQQQLRGRLRFESQEIMLRFQGLVSSTILSLKK